jgi:hypothetical protein
MLFFLTTRERDDEGRTAFLAALYPCQRLEAGHSVFVEQGSSVWSVLHGQKRDRFLDP